MEEKLLRIYLNDHLAGSIVGMELAKRCLSNNEGTPLGSFLEVFIGELEEDRSELERLMESLGFRRDPLKTSAAWTAEKTGRLKFNGQLFGYSDLSRLLELEGLSLGVEGKLMLWRSLGRIAESDARIRAIDLDELTERAERQRNELERFRLDAAHLALV